MNKFLVTPGYLWRQFLVLVLLITSPQAAMSKPLHIVTAIAPVHSLVSMVVGGDNEVTLLIPASQSPHALSLKPSQRRAIDNAQLIVVLSNEFTPSLFRHIRSSSNET